VGQFVLRERDSPASLAHQRAGRFAPQRVLHPSLLPTIKAGSMNQEILRSSTSTDKIAGDPVAELVSTILSLSHDGMSRKAISELLNIHEIQVSYLLDD
jgi:hypothetical protein